MASFPFGPGATVVTYARLRSPAPTFPTHSNVSFVISKLTSCGSTFKAVAFGSGHRKRIGLLADFAVFASSCALCAATNRSAYPYASVSWSTKHFVSMTALLLPKITSASASNAALLFVKNKSFPPPPSEEEDEEEEEEEEEEQSHLIVCGFTMQLFTCSGFAKPRDSIIFSLDIKSTFFSNLKHRPKFLECANVRVR